MEIHEPSGYLVELGIESRVSERQGWSSRIVTLPSKCGRPPGASASTGQYCQSPPSHRRVQVENWSCQHHRMVERSHETASSIRPPPSTGSTKVIKKLTQRRPNRVAHLLCLLQILDRVRPEGLESHSFRPVRSSPRIGETSRSYGDVPTFLQPIG